MYSYGSLSIMSKFSSFKEDQLLFENWRKYTNVRKPQIIKEDLEVVLKGQTLYISGNV